jgi:hypothetical protein
LPISYRTLAERKRIHVPQTLFRSAFAKLFDAELIFGGMKSLSPHAIFEAKARSPV